MDYFKILIFAVFVNNIILIQLLGLCPNPGEGSRIKFAAVTGGLIAVIITLSVFLIFFIYKYLLVPLNAEFLKTIIFILVIAGSVKVIDIIIKKTGMAHYETFKLNPLLLTLNCAILGTVILTMHKNFDFLHSIFYSFSVSLGYVLVLVLLAGINERLEISGMPKSMRGIPISLITAGILSMAFLGFAGLAG
jgi:Na+-translocating ferredoxin:NAD+ oxidoreductase subunit A